MNDSVKLDERCVSWKVLLPVGLETRILAIELDNGGLAGLSRSYRKVDIKPVGHSQYDVVVIGDKSDNNSYDPYDLVSTVKPDGIVVNTSQKCFTKELNDAGFRHSRHYAVLTPGIRRLFIPLGSRELRARGLAFHSPGSFKTRIGLAITKTLSCLGVQAHLMKHTISLYARSEKRFEDMGLVRWLSEQLGYPVIDLVIFAGESPRRKITALAVAAKRNNDVVVKIADTELGAQAIKQESNALHVVAASSLAGQAPKVIAEGQCGSYCVQLQEEVVGSTRKQIARLTKSHLEFLSKLSTIDRKIMPIKETRTWRNIKALAEATSSKTLPRHIHIALQKVLSDESAGVPVVCHRTHGDFAPWNIKVNNGKLFAYDWEDSLSDGLALTDIFHFLYRQASLVGPRPGPVRLIGNIRKSISLLGEEYSYPNFDYSFTLLAWMLHEYLTHPTAFLIELFKFVLGMPKRGNA